MKNITLLIISITLLLICSCKPEQKETMLSADGAWMQLGYGKVFDIKNDSVKIFDICTSGCQLYKHVPLASKGVIESYTSDSMTLRKNIKTYKFVKLNGLPESCYNAKVDQFDPVYNFETLWSTFNEQYCFFEKRNVDWAKTYNTYKTRISEETTELELFQICNEMLNSLNDGHVSLDVPELLQDTINFLKNRDQEVDIEKPRVNRFELGDLIAEKYCNKLKIHNTGIVKWGMMKNNIAYVQVNAMWLLAYYDLPKGLSLNEFGGRYVAIMNEKTFQRQDEINGARLLMDTIVADMKSADALVLDLRFNTGGKDEAGLEIIGHLVDSESKIASKKAKRGSGFTNHQDIFLETRNPNFKKNVYVLTSSMTASAAELAVLATLSNEIYTDLDGHNYEGIGIKPDIELNYPKEKGALLNFILNQLETSGDKAIEQVFKLEDKKN